MNSNQAPLRIVFIPIAFFLRWLSIVHASLQKSELDEEDNPFELLFKSEPPLDERDRTFGLKLIETDLSHLLWMLETVEIGMHQKRPPLVFVEDREGRARDHFVFVDTKSEEKLAR